MHEADGSAVPVLLEVLKLLQWTPAPSLRRL